MWKQIIPVHVSGFSRSYFKCSLYVLYLNLKKVFTCKVIGTRTLQHHSKIGWNSDQSLKCLAWFITDSPVYEKVHAALTNSRLISGIKQASPLSQTSCLEGFHSVLNHFCPKMIAYSFAGMFCRWVEWKYSYDYKSFCYCCNKHAYSFLVGVEVWIHYLLISI